MDGTEKVTGGFVVSCCYGAELLESGKEVFNQMTSFVEVQIVTTLLDA